MSSRNLPAAFHVMAKPAGAACNLRCDYCFYLDKAALYPGSDLRMSDRVLESYLRQTIGAHRTSRVTIAWQGGEPTLMGLPFFRRAVDIELRCLRPGMTVENTLQTNGVLLDDEWAQFLHDNRFLVGLSLDGPRELHDRFRHDRGGRPVFDRVVRAARLMQRRGVEFNVLCSVSSANEEHPLEVYRFFRDELGARYLQLIPIVELAGDPPAPTDRSVGPAAYGRFLVEIFDEWVRRDVGRMFVQIFDGVLAAHVRGESSLCIFRRECGEGTALEHTGDLYSCDHFVDRDHLLGNILETPLVELVASPRQREFGRAKSARLPGPCAACEFLFACHGECPKNRLPANAAGEPGPSWLCEGLKAFFAHTARPMQLMADLLRKGRAAAEVMALPGGERPRRVGRNEPCPCGSGRKHKRCCGARP